MKFWLSIILIVGPLILGTFLSIAKELKRRTKIIVWVICLLICFCGVYLLVEQKKAEEEKAKAEKFERELLERQELRGRGLTQEYIDGLGENPLLRHFFNSGQNYKKEYKFKQAIKEYEKCLSHPGATQENKVAANILIGNCYYLLSELKKAEKHYKEALTISEKVKDKTERLEGKSGALNNLGNVYADLGDFKKAIEYCEKSLEIDKKIGDKASESASYTNLGNAYFGLCDFKKAIEYYLNAEKIFTETVQTHYLKMVYHNLSLAYEKLGDDENAKKYKGLANSK